MSYYEDQEEAWAANDFKGSPSDYDPFDADTWDTGREMAAPGKEESRLLKKLESEAKGKGLKVQFHGNGHFQVRAGRNVINWYPLSKRQTAYANLTGEKRFGLTPEKVVNFALEKVEVKV